MARQGADGEAGVGLARRDPVSARETAQGLDAAVLALAVGRMRHGLGMDGGVGGHALGVLRLDGKTMAPVCRGCGQNTISGAPRTGATKFAAV